MVVWAWNIRWSIEYVNSMCVCVYIRQEAWDERKTIDIKTVFFFKTHKNDTYTLKKSGKQHMNG